MTIIIDFHGHRSYDHRALGYTPPSQYAPGYYFWGICGLRFTPAC